MQYDGSININTRIDTSGVNKGTKSITTSLKGVLSSVMMVAKAMAAAFIGGSIINGIRSLIGQFDLMGSSIGASIKQLSTSFDALKGAFVNLILTALAPLIPYVITFVQWLTRLFTIVTQIIGALFGVKTGFGGVASAAGGAGKATKKAAKEAAGALAAFDQINVLQTKKDEADAGGGDGGAGGLSLPPVDPISPGLLTKLEEFKKKSAEFFKPLTDALGRLYKALEPLGKTIWEGLEWAWKNIFLPLGAWVVSDLLPAFLDLLSAAAVVLNEALIALQPLWQEFFDNFLKPVAEWTGGKIIEILDSLTEKLDELAVWIKENPEKFREFVEILGTLAAIVLLVATSYQIALGLTSLLSTASLVLSAAFWSAAGAALAIAWPIIALTLLIAGIIAVIYLLITNWEELSTTVKQIIFIMAYYIQQFKETLTNAFFTALDAIKSKFESIFTGIQNFISGVINNIIGFINNMIAGVMGGLNGIIGGFNQVGSAVPGFQSVPAMSTPQIPRLAKGAVIPPNAEFAAILGDQKSGMNIETPVDLMRQTFEDVLSKAMTNQNITVRFEGTLAQFVRELKPHIDAENQRIGPSFIRSGV